MAPVRKPCKTCPWRLDQDATAIPGFSLELAEGLRRTTESELGAPQFACHQSTPDQEVVCAGWLARHGWDSIAVRLGLMNGKYHAEQLEPGEDWPELEPNFDAVIEKLRETCPEEARDV
jgi:hypothetical protein